MPEASGQTLLAGHERPVEDLLGDEPPLVNDGRRMSASSSGVAAASTKESGLIHWRLFGDTAPGCGVDARWKMVG
jgi:hypothetical protein